MITFDEWLATSDCIEKEIIENAILTANTQGVALSQALEESPYVTEEQFLTLCAKYYGTEFMSAENVLEDLDKDLLDKISPETVKDYNFIPYRLEGPALYLLVSSLYSVRNAEIMASNNIKCEYVVPIYVKNSDLAALIDKFYTKAVIEEKGIGDLNEGVYSNYNSYDLNTSMNDSYVSRVIAEMIKTAIDNDISDIHIAPEKDDVSIRFRKDGVMFVYTNFKNKTLLKRLVTRIKTLSQLKIEQDREAQSGHFSISHNNKEVNIRVSVLPTIHGIEKITLRILDQSSMGLAINNLYLSPQNKKLFEKLTHNPQGIILITGPTGSGKTTTLYTALKSIASEKINIVTLEDPVEYQLGEYIVQTQYNPEIGMDFAAIFHEVLRQDPDVILVGEIRDRETAKVAIEASNTGHLVFSTLHTNNAIGAITRLSEMGIKPYDLSDSLLAVMAQRLVRRVCPKCGIPHDYVLSEDDKIFFNTSEDVVHGIKVSEIGCPVCRYTGYKGRVPVHELLVVNEEISLMLAEGMVGRSLHDYVNNILKMPKMCDDAYEKLKDGVTTLEEIHRVLG